MATFVTWKDNCHYAMNCLQQVQRWVEIRGTASLNNFSLCFRGNNYFAGIASNGIVE